MESDKKQKLRLSKLMAQRGICSRREADQLIVEGKVYVNGDRFDQPFILVDEDVEVTLGMAAQRRLNEQVTILLHKPVGYVSGQPENNYEPAVRLITAGNKWKKEPRPFSSSQLVGIAPAGRLDIDSRGLLILTQDGKVARQLIGPESGIEKEYIVGVEGAMAEEKIMALRHGLELDGRQLKPAQVELIAPYVLKFILIEGRKRQIRRMCELVGLKVVSLKRERIGKIKLGGLPEGQWRFLGEGETF